MNGFLAILIIALAGPIIGSFLGVYKKYNKKQINNFLAFAAGIMVSISIFELLPESYSKASSGLVFFGLIFGWALMYGLNAALPHFHHQNYHGHSGHMKKTALFIFLGIFIHNLPEGMAIGLGGLVDYNFSLMIALALALHDIPEAICVAAPYYYTTGKKLRSVWMSVLTVIPTIIGFLAAYFLFGGIPDVLLGILVGFTAGIMVYISFFEIIPGVFKSSSKGKGLAVLSFFAGVILVLALERMF